MAHSCLFCTAESSVFVEEQTIDDPIGFQATEYTVQCESCGVSTPSCESEKEAWRIWKNMTDKFKKNKNN